MKNLIDFLCSNTEASAHFRSCRCFIILSHVMEVYLYLGWNMILRSVLYASVLRLKFRLKIFILTEAESTFSAHGRGWVYSFFSRGRSQWFEAFGKRLFFGGFWPVTTVLLLGLLVLSGLLCAQFDIQKSDRVCSVFQSRCWREYWKQILSWGWTIFPENVLSVHNLMFEF